MKETYKALIIGDVVGECGRQALEKTLAELQWEMDVDFTVVNGENISGGKVIIFSVGWGLMLSLWVTIFGVTGISPSFWHRRPTFAGRPICRRERLAAAGGFCLAVMCKLPWLTCWGAFI